MPGPVAFFTVLTCVSMMSADFAEPPIVPRPLRVDQVEGQFTVGRQTTVTCTSIDERFRALAPLAAEYIGAELGHVPAVVDAPVETQVIRLTDLSSTYGVGGEGYALRITPEAIDIQSASPAGAFYGVQTLRQMLMVADPPGTLPCVTIQDAPRYLWRGMLLDCCRHFMDVEFIKRYIDLLALHKMNVLHWHLTEDQGWRIAIERYPRLTDVGAWRGTGDQRYGGFYSREDIRDVVAYAASRFITVVPEIEMPGHARAALAAYPELSCTGGPHTVATEWGVHDDVYCAGNDAVFTFLEGVLDEVIELFPSEYIHIGGDECPKTRWKACSRCQQRMQDAQLADEHELQSYFIKRIETYLTARGRRLIGWDEILEGGLAPNVIVQSWRGMGGAITAATAGHAVIASPTSHCYLDYSHEQISLERAYAFDPTPAGIPRYQRRLVLGIEGNMWTERAPQDRVDHQVFPRLCALAEVAWSPDSRRSWPDFSKRMVKHYTRLDTLGVNYYIPPPACATSQRVFEKQLEVELVAPVPGARVHVTIDGTPATAQSPVYTPPLHLTSTSTVRARLIRQDGRASDELRIEFRKETQRAAIDVPGAALGWRYAAYVGAWTAVPDLTSLTAVASGVAHVCDDSKRPGEENYALHFHGYIEVPDDGVYTFYLTSDDGSCMWLGDSLVVDNDGLHGMVTTHGQAILQKGKHPVRVVMFQAGGAQGLELEYAGPKFERRVLPSRVMWHAK